MTMGSATNALVTSRSDASGAAVRALPCTSQRGDVQHHAMGEPSNGASFCCACANYGLQFGFYQPFGRG
jgi:hypothetical protein